MADFSFLSESDDSAVEDVISQAIDLSVLQQIATINCSGSSDSVLPSDLETRFRKLKSFPGAIPKLTTSNQEKKDKPKSLNPTRKPSNSFSDEETHLQPQFPSVETVNPKIAHEKIDINPNKTSTDSSSGGEEAPNSPPPKSHIKECSREKSRTAYVSTPSISSDSYLEASSPPRQTFCFWCSPKKVSRRKKSKDKYVTGIGIDTLEWGKKDDILSDLSTYSVKEQRRKLKKALKEEERIVREAEKVVQWAKQASARMDVSVIEDILSDDEKPKP